MPTQPTQQHHAVDGSHLPVRDDQARLLALLKHQIGEVAEQSLIHAVRNPAAGFLPGQRLSGARVTFKPSSSFVNLIWQANLEFS